MTQYDPNTGVIIEPAGAPQALQAPPSPRAPETADEIDAAVREAQEKLAEAGGSGAFARDPYRIALAALSVTIGVFPQAVRSVLAAVSSLAKGDTVRRDIVEAVREGIGSAAVHTASLARAKDRRSLAIAGSVALVVGAGLFALGRYSAQAETDAKIRASLAELRIGQETVALSMQDAATWLTLIKANPAPRQAIDRAQQRIVGPSGQPSGLVPLWLDVLKVPPRPGG